MFLLLRACLQGSSCRALLRQWEPLLLGWHELPTAARWELLDKLGSAEAAFYLACRDRLAYEQVHGLTCCCCCCCRDGFERMMASLLVFLQWDS